VLTYLTAVLLFDFHEMSYYMQNFYETLKYIKVKPPNIVSYYFLKII
jgi:hypothetical protein